MLLLFIAITHKRIKREREREWGERHCCQIGLVEKRIIGSDCEGVKIGAANQKQQGSNRNNSKTNLLKRFFISLNVC